jgi:hypothetical protein
VRANPKLELHLALEIGVLELGLLIDRDLREPPGDAPIRRSG